MDINYQYTKMRRDFGRQPMFSEAGPEMCDSIAADVAEQKIYILRNPVHTATQNTPTFSENHLNTIRAEYTTTGNNHTEGGWPRDVHIYDPEMTQRYRRKVEREDNYIHCVMSIAPGMDHYVMQNNAIDMYSIYYSELVPVPGLQRISSRTVNVYRDQTKPTRPVSSVCWQPEGGHRFAVTYNDVTFNRTPRAPLDCYIWNVENAMEPEVTVMPACALLDLQFNYRDPNMLAGGFINGQVGVWDRRIGGAATVTCAPHVAHRDLVRNVIFINAKSGQEFFSGSSDGVCKWWDVRNMSDVTDEMILDVVKSSNENPNMATANGVSVLEFEHTIPTRFMVGTENGFVLGANRKGKTALDKLPVKFEAHVGPVWTVERNPGFLKNFLTVGDWTARVWSEDCRESAILWSPPHRHKVTAGTWSPTRLSLMLLTQWNGALAVWDLLRRQHEPVLSMQVCSEPLLQLRMHEGLLTTSQSIDKDVDRNVEGKQVIEFEPGLDSFSDTFIDGHLVACGSQRGSVYMVELSQALAESDKHDKGLLTLILERESKRERILEARMREIRLKQRQAEEGRGSPAASAAEVDAALGDRDLTDAAGDYMQQVRKEQLAM